MASSGDKERVAIVGGGIAGLSASYFLGKSGFEVDLYEAEERVGGLASSFDLGGLPAERYYHFLCMPDFEILELACELGLEHTVEWRPTETTFFYQGKMYGFTSPLDLLRFDPIPFRSRINMGLESLRWSNIKNWHRLDDLAAKDWLIQLLGEQTYKVVWEPLLTMKFGEAHDRISAAWIWHRVHRVAKSRKTPLHSQMMGYFRGGTETLLSVLVRRIREQGNSVFLSTPVEKVFAANGEVKGIIVGGEERSYGHVILAAPLPLSLKMLPESMSEYRQRLSSIGFLGVVCLVAQMERSISGNFWCNIHDDRIPFNGLTDTSSLNPETATKGNLTYAPYYLPTSHPRFLYSERRLYGEFADALKILRNDMSEKSIKSFRVFRSHNAQAICTVGFRNIQPSNRTPVSGLYIIDSTQLYPSDRTLSGTIGLASRVASMIQS